MTDPSDATPPHYKKNLIKKNASAKCIFGRQPPNE